MQVKVTVSRQGGKTGDSHSESVTMKDVSTIEEVQERIAKEFGDLFPRYASLEAEPKKKSKSKDNV